MARSKEEQARLLSYKNGKASTPELVSVYRRLSSGASIHKKVRLFLASRVDAPHEILEELSKTRDSELSRTLVQNPSLPLVRLLALAERFPWDFIKNPVLPLLLLEDPGLMMMSDSLLTQLISFAPGAVESLWSAVEQRPNVLLSLAYKSSQKESILRRLLDTSAEEAIVVALQNSGMTPALLEVAAGHPSSAVRMAVVGRSIPVDLLIRLAADTSADVRRCVAANRKLPEHILRVLSSDPDLSVVAEVVGNPLSPTDLLDEIYARGLSMDAALFARNPNTSKEILLQLAQYENCLFELAHNPNTPLPALEIILYEKYNSESPVRVLGALATNPNADTGMLLELSFRGTYARRHVAMNINTPLDLLRLLSQDPDEQTSNHADDTLKKVQNLNQ